MELLQRICDWVARTRYPAVPIALGLLLAIPTLWGGLHFDDYGIRIAILDQHVVEGVSGNPWQPFSFLDGDPVRNHKLMDYGFLPWWSHIECRAAFMRPLTGLTHAIDYRLLDRLPMLMHLHSLLWFALLIWAAAILYRRLMGPTMPAWIAALAALLFALDDAHGMPVGWLANRNGVLAGLFGVLTLVVYDRWRRDRWRPGALLAPMMLLAALLSKESGVCTGAYLAAYAVFLDRGKLSRRLMALLPCLMTGALWYSVYKASGFGTAHSTVYIDPAHDPIGFASRVISEGPILLLGQLGLPPSQVSLLCSTSVLWIYWLGSLAVLALIGALLVPLVARDRLARFFATGMVLSILPACSAFASDRLLMFVGIGAMGLVAMFLGGLKEEAAWMPFSKGFNRLAAWFLLLVHLLIAGLLFPVEAGAMKLMSAQTEGFHNTIPDDPRLADQTLVAVNSVSWLHNLALMQIRHYNGQSLPKRFLGLNSSSKAATFTRTDAHTLTVRPQGGFLPPRGDRHQALGAFSPVYVLQLIDLLFRGEDDRFEPGERIELTEVTITVTALTATGQPAEAEFRFHKPLEHPSLRWVRFTEDGYVPFQPPAIGQTVEVLHPL